MVYEENQPRELRVSNINKADIDYRDLRYRLTISFSGGGKMPKPGSGPRFLVLHSAA
jgi:hypothetical protein